MGDSGDYVLSDSLATKKRTRPSSWQRRRQQKNMCSYTSDAGLVHCERIVNCSSGIFVLWCTLKKTWRYVDAR